MAQNCNLSLLRELWNAKISGHSKERTNDPKAVHRKLAAIVNRLFTKCLHWWKIARFLKGHCSSNFESQSNVTDARLLYLTANEDSRHQNAKIAAGATISQELRELFKIVTEAICQVALAWRLRRCALKIEAPHVTRSKNLSFYMMLYASVELALKATSCCIDVRDSNSWRVTPSSSRHLNQTRLKFWPRHHNHRTALSPTRRPVEQSAMIAFP